MSEYGKTDQGFVPKPHGEILESMKDRMRQKFGDDVNLDPSSSVAGHLLSIVSPEISDVWLGAQGASVSHDPDQAEGVELDNVGAINNITRQRASHSHSTIQLLGEEGTVIPKNWPRIVKNSGYRFLSDNEYLLPAAENQPLSITMIAEDSGAIEAPVGTLVEGADLKGVTNITHPASAVIGQASELDPEYRTRRKTAIKSLGAATLPAIAESLKNDANVPGATFSKVFENTSIFEDDNGVPGKSIHPFVVGGEDQDIAETIFLKKAAGIESHGTTKVDVVYNDQTFTMGFSRPVDVPIYVLINLTDLDPDTWPEDGEAQVKQLVIDYGVTKDFGFDVYLERLKSFYTAKVDAIRASKLYVSTAPIPEPPTTDQQQNIVIAPTEIAVFLDGDDGGDPANVYIRVIDGTA